jgi:hypothetical protein
MQCLTGAAIVDSGHQRLVAGVFEIDNILRRAKTGGAIMPLSSPPPQAVRASDVLKNRMFLDFISD